MSVQFLLLLQKWDFNILFGQNYPVPSTSKAVQWQTSLSQKCSLPYHRVLEMLKFRWKLDKLVKNKADIYYT